MTFYDTEERREAYVREALSWKGCPFLLNGHSRQGVGCAGLQREIHKARGAIPDLPLPRATGRPTSDQIALSRASRWFENYPQHFLKVEEMRAGDIVLFRMERKGEFHMGGFLGEGVEGMANPIIQSVQRFDVIVSDLDFGPYRSSIASIWRILQCPTPSTAN